VEDELSFATIVPELGATDGDERPPMREYVGLIWTEDEPGTD
jgi:hypothetical protein